jgi:hypothetical protein
MRSLGAGAYRGCMALTRKFDHESIQAAIWLLSLVLWTITFSISMMRFGVVGPVTSLGMTGTAAVAIWQVQKVMRKKS